MKTIACIFMIILILLSFMPIIAMADEQIDSAVDSALNKLDMDKVTSLGGEFVSLVARMQSVMDGDFDNAEDFMQYILAIISPQLTLIMPSLLIILAVALLCSIATNSNTSLFSSSTSNVIYFVGFASVVTTMLSSVQYMFSSVASLLTDISVTVDAVSPIFLTLMVANGATATAKIYQPTVLMLSSSIVKLISDVVLPLCVFSLALNIISNVSKTVKVDKIAKSASSIASWVLGVSFMVFFAFLTVQGATAMSIDGVSIRAAKFATKSYVPLLGGYLADGFDVIMASTTLIKNSFGLVVLMIIIATAVVPMIYILVYKLALSVVSSIAQPILDSRFVSLFSGVCENLTMLVVIIIAVMFMFFLLIMLAIMTANGV